MERERGAMNQSTMKRHKNRYNPYSHIKAYDDRLRIEEMKKEIQIMKEELGKARKLTPETEMPKITPKASIEEIEKGIRRMKEMFRERSVLLEIIDKNDNFEMTTQEIYHSIPIQYRPYLMDSIRQSLPTVYFILRSEGHHPSMMHYQLARHYNASPDIQEDLRNFLLEGDFSV